MVPPDCETMRKVYECVLERYRKLIAEKESLSVSDLRHRISPYNEFIRKLRSSLIADLQPYEYQKHFFSAVERATSYIRSIQNITLPFAFWFEFEEIDRLKAAPIMDQALLLAALLRSLESKQVKTLVTRGQRPYVYFEWGGERYLINPESGSLLRGDDIDALFATDPVGYAFSDLFFESYEE